MKPSKPTNETHYFTPLDMELRDIAAFDWTVFVQLVGEEAITKAKVCMLLSRGNSLNKIANRMQIPKHVVRHICDNKCFGSKKKKSQNDTE